MASKTKSRLVDQPPSASSSEEQEQVEESQEEEEPSEDEEEEESGEETEGEEDKEEPKTAPPPEKKSTAQKPLQTPQKPPSSSESGTADGSGSDSESDSGQSQPSPSASDFTVKPSAPVKSPSKPATKRPAQETQQAQKEKDSRRKKPKIEEEDKVSDQKKSAGAATPIRLWCDEDQVAILKGMAEFKSQKGIEPNVDMSAFHDFIKGKLQVEVSKSQVGDKIRRLKKKFMTSVKSGEEPVFSKPHDYLVFELSKKIWGGKGDDAGTSNGVVKENVNNNTNGKAKKTAVEIKKSSEPKKSAKVSTFTKPKEDEKQAAVKEFVKEDIVKGVDQQQDFQSKYPHLAASFGTPDLSDAANMLKNNMSLIASDKAQVLEEKWKKLLDEEADLMLKRLDLIREHYKLVVDAMRDSN